LRDASGKSPRAALPQPRDAPVTDEKALLALCS
jgi:hypothetical protein